MVRIITDSTSDLSREDAERLGVTVLPIEIHFGDEIYTDGVDITSEEFYKKLASAQTLPTTSQIPPAIFEETFRQFLDDGDDILCLLLSSKLSGTYQSAQIAAQMTNPDKIFIPDTKSVTFGLGLLVSVICGMRDTGMHAEELAAQTETLSKKLRLIAAVSTLKYLKMGGRLSSSAAVIGGILGICPLVSVEDGVIVAVGKARGMNAAINTIEEMLTHDGYIPDSSMPIAFGHTHSPEMLKNMTDKFCSAGKCALVCDVGSAIGTHVGQGAAGISFFAK